MDEAIETYNLPAKDGVERRLCIYHDLYPESPREWDNLTVFVFPHRSNWYYRDRWDHLTDKGAYLEDGFEWDEDRELYVPNDDLIALTELWVDSRGGASCGPVYVGDELKGYEYDPEDNDGFQGFAFVTKKSRDLVGTPDEYIERVVKGEVDDFDKWCRGEVYGFVIESRCPSCGNWENQDSCWGFYPSEGYGFLEMATEYLSPDDARHLRDSA